MSTSTTTSGAVASGVAFTARATGQIKVWDPVVRVFHWSLASAFFAAFIVEDDLLGVHVWAGYLTLALIAVRLVWGFVGTPHARFSDFVRSPREVVSYLGDAVRFNAKRYIGHNPAGGAMAVALLLLVTLTGLSGIALYGAQELSGPLAPMLSGLPPVWGQVLEETHEVLANMTLAFVFVHLAGVLFSSLSHRENLVRSMLTGLKRRA